jgi:hypothetical protein
VFTVADVNGDGRPEVMAGTGDFGCNSNCFVLSHSGEVIRNLNNDGWSSRLNAIAAGALRPGEPATILCGTSKNGVVAWRFQDTGPKRLWRTAFGDALSVLAVLPVGAGMREAAAIAGSASDHLAGLSPDGRIVWRHDLGSAPTAIAIVPGGEEVLVGTEAGGLYRFEGRRGRPLGRARLDGSVTAIAFLGTSRIPVALVTAGRTLVALTL